MLPDVEKYRQALDAAHAAFGVACTKARQERSDLRCTAPGYTAAQKAYHDAIGEADSNRTEALYAARRDLTKAEDPLVKWIAIYVMPARDDEAETVLWELPATVAELRELAEEHGWCATFDSYLRRAIAAGVISDDQRPLSEVEWELVEWIDSQDDPSPHKFANRLRDVVDAAVAAALQNAQS